MDSFFSEILSILTTPPGNLVYFLVVAFTIAACFQLSLYQWRRSGFPQGRRLVIGLGMLLLVQLAQFVFAGFAWQNLVPSHGFLPPLDRAVTLLTLVVVAWMWLFPEPAPVGDAGAIFMGLIVLVFTGVAWVWWRGQPIEFFYNASQADLYSDLFGLILLAVSSLLLLVRRPNGWGFGLAMNMILLAGYVARFWPFQLESDYVGVIRLTQMMAFPLLLYLPQRFTVPAEAGRAASLGTAKDVRRFRVDPALVNEFLSLAANPAPELISQTVTRLVSELMVADICLLVSPPDASGTMVVSGGYDLIKQLPLEGFSLDSRSTNVLASAMRRGRYLRLPSSSTSPDLASLAQALNLSRSGHLLAAPVMTPGKTPLMGIVLLLPYSNRGWTNDDQNHLVRLCESLAAIFSQKDELHRLREEVENGRLNRTEPIPPASENSHADELRQQLEQLQQQLIQERTRAESLATMVSSEDDYQKKARQLELEIQGLRENLRLAENAQDGGAENQTAELRLALEEIARLNNMMAESDRKLLDFSSAAKSSNSAHDQPELVASIAQELRQPLSSIVVYTDLLLGESVGILGSAQRKFMERIKASVERMGGLTDDLIQLVIDNRGLEFSPEKVDLNEVIDEAVADVMEQMRNRNIILRLDIPAQVPSLQADHDALYQILLHLLQNAGDASPQEGEVALCAQVQTKENEPAFALIQVSDSGGGISGDDLPRIFSRLYSQDNLPIQGTGNTGTGLSIVKSLVEAHGGRMWVDSVMGKGSTFSVLLPVVVEQPAGQDVRG
jgi:signal transduction histidine kinase